MNAELANPSKDVPAIELPIKKFPGATGHYIGEGIRVPVRPLGAHDHAPIPPQIDVVTATADVTVG